MIAHTHTKKWLLILESSEVLTRLDVQDSSLKWLVIDSGCCIGFQLGLNVYSFLVAKDSYWTVLDFERNILRASIPRVQGRRYKTFLWFSLEIMWCYFYSNLLVIEGKPKFNIGRDHTRVYIPGGMVHRQAIFGFWILWSALWF